MKKIKNLFSVLIISFLLISIITGFNNAQASYTNDDIGLKDMPFQFATTTSVNIWTMMQKAIKIVLNIVIGIGVIMLIVGGYKYITAGGEAEKTKSALNTIIYSIIGIAVALLAVWLINFVFKFVGSEVQIEGGKLLPP